MFYGFTFLCPKTFLSILGFTLLLMALVQSFSACPADICGQINFYEGLPSPSQVAWWYSWSIFARGQ